MSTAEWAVLLVGLAYSIGCGIATLVLALNNRRNPK